MQRKYPLEKDEVYHLMNKSIAGYKIFNTDLDYQRMLWLIEYFSISESLPKFSYFLTRSEEVGKTFEAYLDQCFDNPKRNMQVIAYCLMPTHIHLAIKPLRNDTSQAISNVLNSYARYFNIRHKRSGRLWTGPFKNVLVESDEQLWHLTRYLHLNPVTARLVDKAEDWKFSSYHEYVTPAKASRKICEYKDLLEINPRSYRKFVEDQVDYQRELAQVKHLMLE